MIAEPDVMGTAGHLGDRVRATTAGVEGREMDLLCGVVAPLAAEHEGRLLTLQQKVEHETNIGSLCAGRRIDGCRQQHDGCDDDSAYRHGCSTALSARCDARASFHDD